MVKFDNLGWQVRQALQKKYDKQHGAPEKPIWEPPMESRRALIPNGHRSSLAVRMTGSGKNAHRPDEAKAELLVIGATEHISVNLTPAAITGLIDQLTSLQTDMYLHDHEVRSYLAANSSYQEAKTAYEDKREAEIRAMVDTGKYTERQLRDMCGPDVDDIPF